MPDGLTTTGIVTSLQLCPGYRKPMQIVEEAEFLPNLGVQNDKHALPDSSRQVLLIEKETLDELEVSPGEVKENITTTGIDLMRLQHRDRLIIGDSVVLEVTKPCSPCSRMDEIRPGLKLQLAGRRGMLARVLQGGTVRRGYTIRLIDK